MISQMVANWLINKLSNSLINQSKRNFDLFIVSRNFVQYVAMAILQFHIGNYKLR